MGNLLSRSLNPPRDGLKPGTFFFHYSALMTHSPLLPTLKVHCPDAIQVSLMAPSSFFSHYPCPPIHLSPFPGLHSGRAMPWYLPISFSVQAPLRCPCPSEPFSDPHLQPKPSLH
jgi:hypothetical protein